MEHFLMVQDRKYVKFKITDNPNIHVRFNSNKFEFEKSNRG